MSTHRGQGRRRRGNRGIGGNTTTLALKEFWGTVANGISTIDCRPGASKLTKLVNLSAIYETYKLLSWTVHIVHTGGNTSKGSYFMGVSYKSDRHPTDAKGVAALAPVVCKSVHQDASLSVPVGRLMGQPWLANSAISPGAVMLYNDSTDNLQVWVTYRVAFNGPTQIAQIDAYDELYKYNSITRRWEGESGAAINEIHLDFDTYGELEVGASQESVLDQVWQAWARVARTAQELHRMWSVSVGVVHFLMNAGTVALPALAAPAVLHLQRRPFRTSSSEWVRLGLRCVEGPDSRTRGRNSPSSSGNRSREANQQPTSFRASGSQ